MGTAPLEIDNYEKFGKLVKQWAKGTLKTPGTIDAFIEQLVLFQVCTKVQTDAWQKNGPQFKNIMFVQSTDDTLVIRLPHLAMLVDKEANISAGFTYGLPSFYNSGLYKTVATGGGTVEENQQVHNERIGDYTMSQCG